MEKSGVFFSTTKQKTGNEKTAMPSKDQLRRVVTAIGMIFYRLRKVFLAVPVIYYALKLATYNAEHLPADVGLNLQSSGEFAITIARSLAVMGPMGLTFACLLLMFCSRKVLYPWAISIFTLALPILLLVSNIYPS